MKGMNSGTGKPIEDDAWIAQAVADVLLTPIGTRVMRRDYGSLLPALLDQPLNDATTLQIYAASAGALRRWLPELKGVSDEAALRPFAHGVAGWPEPLVDPATQLTWQDAERLEQTGRLLVAVEGEA